MIEINWPEPEFLEVGIRSTRLYFINKFVPVGIVTDGRGVVGAWMVRFYGEAYSSRNARIVTKATIKVAVRTTQGLPYGSIKDVRIANGSIDGMSTVAKQIASDMLSHNVSTDGVGSGFTQVLEAFGVAQFSGIKYKGCAGHMLDDGRFMPSVAEAMGDVMDRPFPCDVGDNALAVMDHVRSVAMPFVETLDPAAIALGNSLGEATLESMCGYAWREQGKIEHVIALWASCLPRRLRGMTPEKMAESAIQDSGFAKHQLENKKA